MRDDRAVIVFWFRTAFGRPGWLRMRGEREDDLGSAGARVRWIVQYESNKTITDSYRRDLITT